MVDPKGTDYSIYRGATLVTPNRKELAEAGTAAGRDRSRDRRSGRRTARALDGEAVLVTRSEEGMTLHARAEAGHVPAYPVRVRDVSGAGDTVAAVMAVLLAMQAPIRSRHAGRQCRRRGGGRQARHRDGVAGRAAPSHPAGGLARARGQDRVRLGGARRAPRANGARQGLRIGFTNGCFDLLHRGHIRLLAEARAACDRLVVGLNSDASTERLKGESRPINAAEGPRRGAGRAGSRRSRRRVRGDTPLELIKRMRPAVLIKGGDYKREDVVGHEVVEAAAARYAD